MTEKYEDIINLPHHVSKTRPQMSMLERAAQFSPFAALNGYDDAVKETGRLTDERIELGDEERDLLDRKQQYLQEIIADRPEISTHATAVPHGDFHLSTQVQLYVSHTEHPMQTQV